MTLPPNGFPGCEASLHKLVYDSLLRNIILRVGIVIDGLEIVTEIPPPGLRFFRRLQMAWRGPRHRMRRFCVRFPDEAPLPQVAQERPDAVKVLTPHIHPESDPHTPPKSQLHVVQNTVVSGEAVLVQAAAVVHLRRAVHRDLQGMDLVLLDEIKKRFEIVAVGDDSDFYAASLAPGRNAPTHLPVLFKEGLTAVKRTGTQRAAPRPVVVQRGKNRVHRFILHDAFQPHLPVFQAVLLEAVRAAEIAVVGGHDRELHTAPAGMIL